MCLTSDSNLLAFRKTAFVLLIAPGNESSSLLIQKVIFILSHWPTEDLPYRELLCPCPKRLRLERSGHQSKIHFLQMMKMYVEQLHWARLNIHLAQHPSSNRGQTQMSGEYHSSGGIWYFLLEGCWPSTIYGLRKAWVGSSFYTFKNPQQISLPWASVLELL